MTSSLRAALSVLLSTFLEAHVVTQDEDQWHCKCGEVFAIEDMDGFRAHLRDAARNI